MKTILLVLALVGAVAACAQAQTYDLATDWPATLEDGTLPLPAGSGVWKYGYGILFDPAALTYKFSQWNATQPSQWGIMNNGVYKRSTSDAPFIGKNLGGSWGGTDLPVGSIGGHTDISDPITWPTMYRFTAPSDMIVNITAKAWVAYMQADAPGDAFSGGRDYYMNVCKGSGNALFPVTWVKFTGDGIKESDQKTVLQAFGVQLMAGDTLDFIDYNNVTGGIHGNDFTVEVVPEPASLMVLGSGLLGAAGFLRRRK